MSEKIEQIIAKGEGLKVEFKEAKGGLPKSIFETICAFSNAEGGEILLGVKDNGEVLGVDTQKLSQYHKDFANTINNPSKVNPQLFLYLEEFYIDGKLVLHTLVPKSSTVHRCNNRIFLRNHDGDMDITDQNRQVSRLYANKDTSYTENNIYPNVKISNFREDLIERARKMAVQRVPEHPWKYMNNEELLLSAGLYKEDTISQKKGYTLASILLFGTDSMILDAIPHHRTDLILRVQDKDRYDDRDTVKTNLIESYDRIMAFVRKHLPSPFYLEGDIRIDVRDILFREIAVNSLIHREFTFPYYARLIIEADKISLDNANKPYINGNINPDKNMPHPKNPILANFFKDIGLADELGSGVRKIKKYAKFYAGHNPVLDDSDDFKLEWKIDFFSQFVTPILDSHINPILTKNMKSGGIILTRNSPTTPQVTDKVSDQVNSQVTEESPYSDSTPKATPTVTPIVTPTVTPTVTPIVEKSAKKILDFCTEARKASEIMEFMEYKDKNHFLYEILKPLLDKGLISRTNPNSPKAPNQKYITVKREVE